MIKDLREKGFTLIELITVMTVLTIMAGIVLINVNPIGQGKKQDDTKRKADLAKIQSMLERYYIKEGTYPNPNPAGRINCDTTLTSTDGKITFGKIPCAPNNDGTSYFYTVYNDSSTNKNIQYCLRACFEVAKDPLRDEKNAAYCSGNGCNNPTPVQMGVNCSALDNCSTTMSDNRKSYTIVGR